MFGEANPEAAPTVTQVVDDNLSDTRLTNLVLKGTIASEIPEFSVAVIADGTAEQKVYAIGDSVGPGVVVRPCHFEPTFQKHAEVPCGGGQLHVLDPDAFEPIRATVAILAALGIIAAAAFYGLRVRGRYRVVE